jgi:hypothetical protein
MASVLVGPGGGLVGAGGGLVGPAVDDVVASASVAWFLEMEFDGAGNGWTDVSADVRILEGVSASYGIEGNEPTDRTASSGELTFTLNNKVGGLVGYYSLEHANRRAGFGFDIGVRLRLTYFGTSYYKFLGRLAEIDPVPGMHDGLMTRCVALDWMDDAAREDLPDLDAQQGKRADELIALVLDAMELPPAARQLDAGSDLFEWALDGAASQDRKKVREVLHLIAASEGGKVYLRGDTTQGGTLRFERRQASVIGAVAFEFDDDLMLRGTLETQSSRDDIVGRVLLTVHPTRVSDTATDVLFDLQTTETLIAAGEILDTLFGPFRDPSSTNGELVGGTAFESPTAHTDYEMNSAADGSGTDLTASFTVSASTTGRGVRWTIENTGGVAGYVTKLQLRGKGIYRRDVIVEQSTGAMGKRILELDMPFQNSVNVAHSVGSYLSYALSTSLQRVNAFRFRGGQTEALMVQALSREPGDRIVVRERVTGIDGTYVINHVLFEILNGASVWCTFGLAPAKAAQQYWLAGVAGYSEAGATTYAAP